MFLAAMIVGGAYMAARYLPHGEAHAGAVVSAKVLRTQEIVSVAIDTPTRSSQDRRLPFSELRALLTTKPGEMLDEAKLDADRRALQEALAARGYLAAKVAPASVTFANTGAAYVVFDIDRGPMFHLRSVTITGPGESDANIVTLSAGDDAVRSRLDRARQALADVLVRRSSKARVELRIHEDLDAAVVDVELATTEVTVLRQTQVPSRSRI
jgi:outer membrane translocation and assembly module TamA